MKAALKASAELSMASRRPMAGSDQAAKAVGMCQSAPSLQVFIESSMPIINFYDAKGRVRKIDADRCPEEVYADVRPLVQALQRVAM